MGLILIWFVIVIIYCLNLGYRGYRLFKGTSVAEQQDIPVDLDAYFLAYFYHPAQVPVIFTELALFYLIEQGYLITRTSKSRALTHSGLLLCSHKVNKLEQSVYNVLANAITRETLINRLYKQVTQPVERTFIISPIAFRRLLRSFSLFTLLLSISLIFFVDEPNIAGVIISWLAIVGSYTLWLLKNRVTSSSTVSSVEQSIKVLADEVIAVTVNCRSVAEEQGWIVAKASIQVLCQRIFWLFPITILTGLVVTVLAVYCSGVLTLGVALATLLVILIGITVLRILNRPYHFTELGKKVRLTTLNNLRILPETITDYFRLTCLSALIFGFSSEEKLHGAILKRVFKRLSGQARSSATSADLMTAFPEPSFSFVDTVDSSTGADGADGADGDSGGD